MLEHLFFFFSFKFLFWERKVWEIKCNLLKLSDYKKCFENAEKLNPFCKFYTLLSSVPFDEKNNDKAWGRWRKRNGSSIVFFFFKVQFSVLHLISRVPSQGIFINTPLIVVFLCCEFIGRIYHLPTKIANNVLWNKVYNWNEWVVWRVPGLTYGH